MARTVKAQEYAAKRSEILDVAQKLIIGKGYERMKIQDILDELRISKGAFYHYFHSKQELVEALADRLMDEAERRLSVIVDDPDLTALGKFEEFFIGQRLLGASQKSFLLPFLRAWYHDDNALTRDKLRLASKLRLSPLLTAIIYQGIDEGVLTTPYPDQAAEVFLILVQAFSDLLARLILAFSTDDDIQPVERAVMVYVDAFERILGTPSGSLRLGDVDFVRDWIESMQESAQ